MPASPPRIELAGRNVSRLGVSLQALRVTGMWGEPTGRSEALGTVRRALELGVDVVEVPVPFGPGADLVREVAGGDVFVIARLTGAVANLDVLRVRLGRRPDLILAEDGRLEALSGWGVPLGALVGPWAPSVGFAAAVAVRGPWPAPEAMVEWCENRGLSYLTSDPGVLGAGRRTIALPGVSSVGQVERLLGDRRTTPPAGGPG